MSKIKVLVIDDSLLFREFMTKGLDKDSDIEIVGCANDPFEAKDKIPALMPDVITLDIEMPRMDGIKFLRNLMSQYPLPVIVISSLSKSVFEAIDAGALDFVPKPETAEENEKFFKEIANKIVAASQTKFAYRRKENSKIELAVDGVKGPVDPKTVIAIGASTGGTDAIYSILTKFSSNMPGIVIVQHMPAGFTSLYAQRLNSATNFEVIEAKDGDEIKPGRILLAPGDYHMSVVAKGAGYAVKCDQTPKVNGHRPSVDVLFKSVADVVGQKAFGVILTGMGNDGADGLKKIREAGGYTIGQDERSSIVYGMPMAAYVIGGVMIQLPLYRIADELTRKLSAL